MEKDIFKQYLDIIDKAFIISETDLKGTITYVNENFEKISKYSAKELIGKPHNIVRAPDMPKKVFEDLWATIQRGEIWEGRIKNRAKDGSYYYVKSVIAPIKDDKGNNLYYVSFRQDITELVELKNKFALEKTLLTNVINNTNNLILIRKNFKPFKANKKFLEEFNVKSIKEFYKKYKNIHHLFEKKEGCFYSEDKDWDIKNLKKELKVCINGKIFLLFVNHFRLKNDKYSIITLTDVTDIENARIKAEEAYKLKSQFLANISHEIRTPLNSIIGYINLLSDIADSFKQKEYINYIQTSADTLMDIVNSILDFSKIESGKLTLEYIKINLYDLIISTFNSLKPLADKKGIGYKLEIKPSTECIEIDPIRLKQVLINLLNNAIKFTEKGEVKLVIEEDFTFRVIDTGIGIPKEKQSKIFEAYLQAEDSTTRKFGGTGLGLAISSRLVEMMGGELKVKSEVNKGSEFYFKISPKTCNELKLKEKTPVVSLVNNKFENEIKKFLEKFDVKIGDSEIKITTDPQTAKELNALLIEGENYLYDLYYNLYHYNDEKKEQNLFFPNARLLVAEDYELNRLLIKEILNKFGINPDFAIDGEEAVKKGLENNYDLILMDVTMPKLNGIEAAKKIKEHKNTPIIAATAHAFKEEKEKILKTMDGYISKPINFDELAEILNKYLKASDHSFLSKISKKFNLSLEESKNIVDIFLKNAQKAIEEIKEANNKKDYEKLYEIFHNLKSSAGYLELNKLYEVATDYMKKASKKIDTDYTKAIEEIKKTISSL